MPTDKPRYWPDLGAYGLGLWIERRFDPQAPVESPRRYRFHCVPLGAGPLRAGARALWEQLLQAQAQAPDVTPDLPRIPWGPAADHTPERPHYVWEAPAMLDLPVCEQVFPEAVIRPLESLTRGPWWRDYQPESATGAALWYWRVRRPAPAQCAVLPEQEGGQALWVPSLAQVQLYQGFPVPVTREEHPEGRPLGDEPRHGGVWLWTHPERDPTPAEARLVPTVRAGQTLPGEREDAGDKVGMARKDMSAAAHTFTPIQETTERQAGEFLPRARNITRESVWPAPTEKQRQAFLDEGGDPLLWELRECVRQALPASAAGLLRIKNFWRDVRRTSRRFNMDDRRLAQGAVWVSIFPFVVGALRDRMLAVQTWPDLWRAWPEQVPLEQNLGRDEGDVLLRRALAIGRYRNIWWGTDHEGDISHWQDPARGGDLPARVAALPPESLMDFLEAFPRRSRGIQPRIIAAWQAKGVPYRALLTEIATRAGRAFPPDEEESVPFGGHYDHSLRDFLYQRVAPWLQGTGILVLPILQEPPPAQKAKRATEGPAEALLPSRKTPSPHLRSLPRTGPAWRAGDVTEAMVMETFGLRAIEYGNWVKQADRQQLLNASYDGFMDLSKACGIPPVTVGFGGGLALALGARGRGGRTAAHYERDHLVINLTKTVGMGALAHEWVHALDHQAQRQHVWQGFPVGGAPRTLDLATTVGSDTQTSPLGRHLRAFVRALQKPLADDERSVAEAGEARWDRIRQHIDQALMKPLAWCPEGPWRALIHRWVEEQVVAPLRATHEEVMTFAPPRIVRGELSLSWLLPFTERKGQYVYSPQIIERHIARDYPEEYEALTPEERQAIQGFFRGSREGIGAPEQAPVFDYQVFRQTYNFLNKIGTRTTSFYENAQTLKDDKPQELLARALSAVIHDRLMALGIQNDFLSGYSAPGQYPTPPYKGSPNPEGEERARMGVMTQPIWTQLALDMERLALHRQVVDADPVALDDDDENENRAAPG